MIARLAVSAVSATLLLVAGADAASRTSHVHVAQAGEDSKRFIVSGDATIQRYLRAIQQHDYDRVMACFAENAMVDHPIFGKQRAAEFFKGLLTKTTADKLTLKTIFSSVDNPRTMAALFFDEWKTADGTEFKNDMVLIFDFDDDARIRKLTVIFDTFPARGKL